jgi:hypothetical protein
LENVGVEGSHGSEVIDEEPVAVPLLIFFEELMKKGLLARYGFPSDEKRRL